MHWSHRIVKKTTSRGVFYGIHEVFFDKDGKPEGCTVDPVAPFGDTIGELRRDYERQAMAFHHEPLDFHKDFPEKPKKVKEPKPDEEGNSD